MNVVECCSRWPLPTLSIKYPTAGFGAAVMVVVSAARSIQKDNEGIVFGFQSNWISEKQVRILKSRTECWIRLLLYQDFHISLQGS